jgi:hypothetical protein
VSRQGRCTASGERRGRNGCGVRGSDFRLVAVIGLRLIGCTPAALAALPAAAIAQQAPSPGAAAPQTADQELGGGPEGDLLTRTRLFQLYYAVKTAPGSGPDGTIRTVTTDTFKLRGDTNIDLNSDWQLALRADLPFENKDAYNSSNPNADFLHGLGDADVQAALVHQINDRWTAGAGARLIMPTGDWDNGLGSGKWQIMPIAGVRYALPEISPGSYLEPLMRYDQSFAGDPAKRAVSNLQFAPMVNLSLPDRFYFTLYPNPDIRWNFGPAVTGQTGRLFLPFNARIGRKFSKTLNVSLEVGLPIIRQYPVYDFTSQLRVNINF